MSDAIAVTTTDLVPTPLTGTVGTDFLTFAVGSGANIEAQADYLADPLRATGNLPGIARSNFNNKATRQGTFVAHSLCLWISQQIQQYVPDDGNDIAWIGEWTSALSAYMLTLIPPGPNLGAYLPLAGGQMSGNITFVSGISTVLANNTWYYAKDTVGTNRGLILKSSDNNVYINDGSSVYVMFNGIPVTNNNYSWSGKDTGGVVRALIGLLSDNSVHVGSGVSTNIYLDTTAAGSVIHAGNATFPNNAYAYWRDSGGTVRAVLGMNTANALVIGSGVTGTTEIYAGAAQPINFHNQVVALSGLLVNTFAYLNGGGRAWIPGGNDPWALLADAGFYARQRYTVTSVRDWYVGCGPNGYFGFYDATANATRFEIDSAGNARFYQSLTVSVGLAVTGALSMGSFTCSGAGSVNNGLTVSNALNVASGNLTVSGGVYAYNTLSVYNGLTVWSGGLVVNGAANLKNGLTVSNNFYMASGAGTFNGALAVWGEVSAYSVKVGGVSPLYDDSASNYNTIACAGNLWFWNGVIRAVNLTATANLNAGYIKSTSAVDCDHVYAYNYIHADGALDIYGYYGRSTIRGALTVVGDLQTDGVWVGQSIAPNTTNYGWCGFCNHQWYACLSLSFGTESGREIKRDIAPMPEVGLALVNSLQPSIYKLRVPTPKDHGVDAPDHPISTKTHWGFIYEDVAKVMEDRDLDFAGAFEDMGVGMLFYNELTSVLWQAVRELSAKVEKLEAQLH